VEAATAPQQTQVPGVPGTQGDPQAEPAVQSTSKGYVVLVVQKNELAIVGGYRDGEPHTFKVSNESAALKEAWGFLHHADPQFPELLIAVPRRSFRVRTVDWPGVGKPFRIE
jgi:hypothetical protein